MKDEIEQYARDVMEAVNKAPDGAWIAGSEERVRDLSAELRRKVFEPAVQQRLGAASAWGPGHSRRCGECWRGDLLGDWFCWSGGRFGTHGPSETQRRAVAA